MCARGGACVRAGVYGGWDMGQQMGYRSLEWNWPKEAMNRPIWAGIVDGAKLF